MAIVYSAVTVMYRDGDGGSCIYLCVVQKALELSGAAESALVWPRFLDGTLGRGTERMYPFARVPTAGDVVATLIHQHQAPQMNTFEVQH